MTPALTDFVLRPLARGGAAVRSLGPEASSQRAWDTEHDTLHVAVDPARRRCRLWQDRPGFLRCNAGGTQRIVCLETPSDIRGGGHVGELSSRITEAFNQAKSRANAIGRAILVIDEADDLATGRSQMQAHHEDRAGVNVLIKQINQLASNGGPIAMIMITNRADVFDTAVLRRAALQLKFERPSHPARLAVFRRILEGTPTSEKQLEELVRLTANKTPYTFSDLTDRIARLALRRAWKSNQPFGFGIQRGGRRDRAVAFDGYQIFPSVTHMPASKRRNGTVRRYSDRVLKLLWGRAAGRCAMPQCRIALLAEATDHDPVVVIEEIAHVTAAGKHPRYKPSICLGAKPGGDISGRPC